LPAPWRCVDLLAAAALLALTTAWWAGTLTLGLHQDDFLRAGPLRTPYRAAFVGFIHAMWAIVGPRPEPYRVVVLALHTIAGWLAFRFAVRLGARPVFALLAALGFVASSTHAYSIYNVASGADVAAAAALLVSLHAALSGRAGRSAAAFALALLCKESVVLLPLVLPFLPGPTRGRIPWAHAAASAAWIGVLAATHGLNPQEFPRLYVMASPLDAVRHLMAYLTASVDWFGLNVDPYRNVPRPVTPVAIALVGVWLLCIRSRRLRRWAIVSGVWYMAALVPFLTTRSMFVLYYLYVPLLGAVIFAAGAATALRIPPAAAAGALAVFLAGSASTLERIEAARLGDTQVHAQSSLRHAQVAANTLRDVAGVPLGRWVALAFPNRYPASARRNKGWYDLNVMSAISDGRAIALTCPGVESVERPLPGQPYEGWTWLALSWDGHVRAVVPPASPRADRSR
jgi:hypothetical protein